jgi:pyruvate formate lyase activating enzyme
VAGLTGFTSIDFPGRLAAVVWVQGCAWRCGYCHNPHLQPRQGIATGAAGAGTQAAWSAVLEALGRRVGFIDGVVFSGGEPTTDPALPQAMVAVRALGLQVGLHSAGMAPQRLAAVLPLLDWVGLDLKAPLAGAHAALHDRITGRRGQQAAVARSLGLLQAQRAANGLDWECRSTLHPAWHDEAALQAMADDVLAAEAPAWALQIARPDGVARPLPAVGAAYPPPSWVASLRARVPGLQVRRG